MSRETRRKSSQRGGPEPESEPEPHGTQVAPVQPEPQSLSLSALTTSRRRGTRAAAGRSSKQLALRLRVTDFIDEVRDALEIIRAVGMVTARHRRAHKLNFAELSIIRIPSLAGSRKPPRSSSTRLAVNINGILSFGGDRAPTRQTRAHQHDARHDTNHIDRCSVLCSWPPEETLGARTRMLCCAQ